MKLSRDDIEAGLYGASPEGDASDPASWSEEHRGEMVRRRTVGRIAAALFLLGAAMSIPTFPLVEPPSSRTAALVACAVVAGIVCLAAPWERLSPRWFHLVAVVATTEIAVAIWNAHDVGVNGDVYAFYYVFVVLLSGYVFRERRELAIQVAVVSLALLAPLVYTTGMAEEEALMAIIGIPSLIAAAAVVAFLRERLEAGQAAYRSLSRRDPLTGVGNYRYMRERLDHELARHRRRRRRFAVLTLDLAGFKQVNEQLGHLEGDRVLQEVGSVLRQTVREEDAVARQGGDEFCVIAPETSGPEVGGLAFRIHQALSRIVVDGHELAAASGWAVYPDHGDSANELLSHADAGMRRDKRVQHSAASGEAAAGRPLGS